MKEHTYTVELTRRDGTREQIGKPTSDPNAARLRARALLGKKRRREVTVLRDGRDLPGGAYALDKECYAAWLESHQDAKPGTVTAPPG